MAFLCPSRRGRQKKKRNKEPKPPFLGRITGSSSVDTLVRVGLEKQHGLSPESRMKVVQDFFATADGELNGQRGDVVYMLYRENDWIYAITDTGVEGFLPFMCVEPYKDNDKSRRKRTSSTDYTSRWADENSMRAEEGSDGSSASPALVRSSSSSQLQNISNPIPKPARTFSNVPDVVSGNSKAPLPNDQISRLNSQESLSKSQNSKTSIRDLHTPEADPVTEVKTFTKAANVKMLVVFPFEMENENDLSVDRGEVVTVLNKDDPLWTWVRRLNGQEGFVPFAFMCPYPDDLHTNKPTDSSSKVAPAPPISKYHDVRELITLRDFTAQSADDICVTKGEHVFADLANQIEKDWLWVYAASTGLYGYIPKDNVSWPSDFPKKQNSRRNHPQQKPP